MDKSKANPTGNRMNGNHRCIEVSGQSQGEPTIKLGPYEINESGALKTVIYITKDIYLTQATGH